MSYVVRVPIIARSEVFIKVDNPIDFPHYHSLSDLPDDLRDDLVAAAVSMIGKRRPYAGWVVNESAELGIE